MRSCYEKVKSTFGSKSTGAAVNSTTTTNTGGLGGVFPSIPSSPSRSSARHAKCLQPISSPIFPSSSSTKFRMRKHNKGSSGGGESTPVLLPGTAPIAQIRSLPLHISQIRSFDPTCGDPDHRHNGHRSSYIINSSKVRNLPNIKRSRSLSPEILRNTGSEPLQSPILVRSAVLSRKPHKTTTTTGSSSASACVSVFSARRREPGTRTYCKSPPSGISSSSSPYSTYNLVKGRNSRFSVGKQYPARLRVNRPLSSSPPPTKATRKDPHNFPALARTITRGSSSPTCSKDTFSTPLSPPSEKETKVKVVSGKASSSEATTAAAVVSSSSSVPFSPVAPAETSAWRTITGRKTTGGLTKTYFPLTSTWPKCKGTSSNSNDGGGGESGSLVERQCPKAPEHQKLSRQRHHGVLTAVVGVIRSPQGYSRDNDDLVAASSKPGANRVMTHHGDMQHGS